MTPAERVKDWCRFYSSAPDGYKPKALEAVLANDGLKVLADVLKALGLEKSVDLVLDWSNDAPRSTVEAQGSDG